jgi:hypothetical protein
LKLAAEFVPAYIGGVVLRSGLRDETVLHYCCRYGFGSRFKYGHGRTEKTVSNSSHEVATVSTCATSSMASQQSNIQGIRGT